MFLTDCPVCGRRELRSPRVLTLTNTATGIDVTYGCRGCGETVTERLGVLAVADKEPAPLPVPVLPPHVPGRPPLAATAA